jgi:hypothetical protein
MSASNCCGVSVLAFQEALQSSLIYKCFPSDTGIFWSGTINYAYRA